MLVFKFLVDFFYVLQKEIICYKKIMYKIKNNILSHKGTESEIAPKIEILANPYEMLFKIHQ